MRKRRLNLIFAIFSYFGFLANGVETVNITDLNVRWQQLIQNSSDPHRNRVLLPALQSVVGIYDHVVDLGDLNGKLSKTVLALVIQSYDPRDMNEKYRQYLFNLLCFFKHYRLKAVIYIISQDNRLYELNKQEMASFSHGFQIVPYPYELFWQVVARKDSPVYVGKGKADFKGDLPSFEHFGALPMLVPLLELLQHGYNFIYLDLDIGFMDDPIPHMLRGDADINITPEVRTCLYPSFVHESMWPTIEPNTGTMFIQSSNQTIEFFEAFLGRIVNSNSMNDQRCVNFGQLAHATWTKSCDPNFQHAPSYKQYEHLNDSESASKTLKYCFLSEFIFHNGYMELFCGKGRRQGVKASMHRLALSIYGLPTAPDHSNRRRLSYLLNPHLSSSFPHYASIHVNYCGTKHRCLEDRGLWLHHRHEAENHTHFTHTCRVFNMSQTPQGLYNWSEAITQASHEFRRLYEPVIRDKNDSSLLLQFHGKTQTFYWNRSHDGEGVLQPYRDLPSMKWHQGKDSVKKITVLKEPWFILLPYGAEIVKP